jgi:hypothetical protein
MIRSDQWTNLHARHVPWADDHLRGSVRERLQQPVRGRANGHCDRTREAALPGIAECRVENRRHRDLWVGVRHHDDVVLGAAERLHPLPVGRGRDVYVPCHRLRPDE